MTPPSATSNALASATPGLRLGHHPGAASTCRHPIFVAIGALLLPTNQGVFMYVFCSRDVMPMTFTTQFIKEPDHAHRFSFR